MSVRVWMGISIVIGLAYLGYSLARHGFSAKEKPSRFEELLARHARRIATPGNARQLKNPYSFNRGILNAVREHWIEHCAFCHGSTVAATRSSAKTSIPKLPI